MGILGDTKKFFQKNTVGKVLDNGIGWVSGGSYTPSGRGWTQGNNYGDSLKDIYTLGAASDKGKGPLGGMGGLNGKKQPDIKPDDIATSIRKMQERGALELGQALDTPADQVIGEGIERQKKGILSSAQDARRNAQRLMAQRGLAGSSLGLAQNREIDQQAGENIANLNAQAPGMIRDQRIKDAQTRIQVGGIGTGAGINYNTIEGQKSGGMLAMAGALAPLAGTVIGGIYGGPVGAAAGNQVGQGIGGMMQPKPQPSQEILGSNNYSPNKYSMGNYNLR